MANNAGKTVATLLIGTAIGAAVGYMLATDSEKRSEQVEALKEKVNRLKDKLRRKTADIEDEIYNA